MKAKSELFKGKKFYIELQHSYNQKLDVMNAYNKQDNSILQYNHKQGALFFWSSDNIDGDPFEYNFNETLTGNLAKFKSFLIEWGEEPSIVQKALNKAIDIIVKTQTF